MSFTEYFLFIIAAVTQVSTPKPSTIFLVDNALKYIPARVILIHTANLLAVAVLASFSLLGISSLLLANPEFIVLIKLAGSVYLFWLGLYLILTFKNNQVSSTQQVIYERISVLWGRSFMAEINRPKKIAFFSSLLPQFVENPQSLQTGDLFSLILLFVFIKFLFSIVYVLISFKVARGAAEFSVTSWCKRARGGVIMFIGMITGVSSLE